MKACAGCRKVWYCSKQCQQKHWKYHIFDCKTGKPISTVYHLARACNDDLVPMDPQTRKDYGFAKAEELMGGEAEVKLLGLYQGLFGALQVQPKEVRQWQNEGTLIEGIKAAFETIPSIHRGGYYPWFLENQHILDGRNVDENDAIELTAGRVEGMLRAGWVLTGGSPQDSDATISRQLRSMPAGRASCHFIYAYAASSCYPGPYEQLWRTFGFVAASSQAVELDYGRAYHRLAKLCPLKEFCDAFEAYRIPSLFDKYRISLPKSHHLFRDVMSGPSQKSVWDLKHYVDWSSAISEDFAEKPRLTMTLVVDYGFMNCKNDEESRMLVDIYTKLFSKLESGMDPLALHDACLQGKLVDFVRGFVKLAPYTAKYTRLLKNDYPLPDFESQLRYVCIQISIDDALMIPIFSRLE